MRKLVLLAFAAAALLCACNREIAPDVPVASGTSLTISCPDTKTVLGEDSGSGHQLYWADGDMVNVNGSPSAALSEVPSGSTSARFDFPQVVLTAPYNAVYPASIWKNANMVQLPHSATSGIIPLGGISTDDNLTLNPLTSAVRIKIKSDGNHTSHNIRRVELTSDEASLSGVFDVDFENATISPSAAFNPDRMVIVEGDWALSETEAIELVIPVPAGTYGLTVKILDKQGHFMEKATTSSKTFTKGTIKAFPEIVFTPTGTQFDITINSADDLVQFAQNYNGRKLDSPVACLGSDIIFDDTTSAAFAATGGIGCKDAEGDHYFDGVFAGYNHTISGYTGSVPLFKYTSSSAEIKDFKLTGVFSFTHPGGEQAFWGTVAGYHRGLLENVSVEGDITVSAGDIDQATFFGGIAGRVVVGTLKNCSYKGAILVPAEFSVSSQKTYFGGIAGAITNAAGLVTYCSFDGTIDFAGRVASTDKTNPFLMFGGVVGSNIGTVSYCTTAKHDVLSIYNEETLGTIMNRSTLTYNTASGGIVGLNTGTVTACENMAGILNFITTTGADGTASDANSRYIHAGGVVGYNSGTVDMCFNAASIIQRCTPRLQKLGGIVGNNAAEGIVTDCHNMSEGPIEQGTTGIGPYGVRQAFTGGVIGENHSSQVSNVSNDGAINLSRVENNANAEVRLGGIIGSNHAAIEGGTTGIINSGSVAQNNGSSTNQATAGYSVGGVIGYSEASVKNVTNEGVVTYKFSASAAVTKVRLGGVVGYLVQAGELDKCVNNGEVCLTLNNQAHTENFVGGVLAYCTEGAVISNCSNAGYVHGGNSSKQNGKTLYLGGIAAYLSGASSITGCTNTGKLLNDQFNNTNTKVGSTFQGGIAGFVVGTEEARIVISDVTNDYDNGGATTGGRRGFTGGAVGYCEYTDITNATNTNSFGGGSGYWYGGIAGWIVNSTVKNSISTGTSIASSQVQGAGGIVCTLDAGSTIDGCSSYLNSITHASNACVNGAVAAKSVAGSTIKNCHYNNTYAICSDANFTDGGGNVADL